MKYCRNCQDYYPVDVYPQHMKQHEVGLNSDAMEHKQYTGNTGRSKSGSDDYMICVLHQKKLSGGCPVKGCNLKPFGAIRKSWMIENARKGVFHTSDLKGNQILVPINMESKTVILFGATIHLKI
ncbi:MAG: hypothetical protein K5790_10485 [Nitrosopumilus sp.]|uniref:hypothetical protein n=1 Tax=Nitrosopumilus sp. TaxID=2024843 RepID=UPI00247E9E55|nr:hypothetical protein [Nitrosopumilus sp.]MCV0393697.1 hypothetical protein [Nitrosopumilus sp.]